MFELDEGSLRRVFLQKSRGVHPDRYKGVGEVRSQSMEWKYVSVAEV